MCVRQTDLRTEVMNVSIFGLESLESWVWRPNMKLRTPSMVFWRRRSMSVFSSSTILIRRRWSTPSIDFSIMSFFEIWSLGVLISIWVRHLPRVHVSFSGTIVFMVTVHEIRVERISWTISGDINGRLISRVTRSIQGVLGWIGHPLVSTPLCSSIWEPHLKTRICENRKRISTGLVSYMI